MKSDVATPQVRLAHLRAWQVGQNGCAESAGFAGCASRAKYACSISDLSQLCRTGRMSMQADERRPCRRHGWARQHNRSTFASLSAWRACGVFDEANVSGMPDRVGHGLADSLRVRSISLWVRAADV